MSRFLGIAREAVYSPGKVDDDRAILDAVATLLRERHGHDVEVVSGDRDLPEVDRATVVFAMCQGPGSLAALDRWKRAGVRVVNSPEAIRACHRRETLAAFARHAVPHPESVLVATGDGVVLPDWIDSGAWLKRADVHAVQAGDVTPIANRAAAREVLASLRARGIGSAVVQRHVAGEVVKFYAVRGGFFAYYSDRCGGFSFSGEDEEAMRALAAKGAQALGLEVFGGDLVRDRNGVLALIDLNDWPSYGRCRATAADAISAYLDAQTE